MTFRKALLALALQTLLLVFVASAPTQLQLLSPEQSKAFVKTRGTQFTLNDKPFYFGGGNRYGLFYDYTEDVVPFFENAVKTKTSVVRTWMFCDGRDCGSTSHSTIDFYFSTKDPKTGQILVNQDMVSGIGRMDYVLQQASLHGVKLILTLSNNWADFNGVDFYVKEWGSKNQFHSEFYSNPDVKTQFKSYISQVLNRRNTLTGLLYKDDPAILAWELSNESRCVGSGGSSKTDPSCSIATITDWVKEMSSYIKKDLGAKQLLGIGDEGFFNNGPTKYPGAYSNVWDGSTGLDFAANAALENIDILGFHCYFDQWNVKKDPEYIENTLQWIKDHHAASVKAGKPLYIGEYGIDPIDMRNKDMPQMQALVESLDIAGSLIWTMNNQNATKPCNEIRDNSGFNYGFCFENPSMPLFFGKHAEAMWKKN